jgi:D-alanyl-D-alanine carboxypeptidase
MSLPHFRLISDTDGFKETSKVTFAKYIFLALLIGVSVTSFLTQGVLIAKDLVFGNSSSSTQNIAQNTAQNGGIQNPNLLAENSQNQNGTLNSSQQNEPLGSDDGSQNDPTNDIYQNQYQLSNETDFPKLSARSFLAADLHTGEIIIEQNENLIAPIASVTKLMTGTVVQENMDSQKLAIVSRDSYNTYGTQGELLLGEKIKVYDLMYPLLMESSNDAAEVLADAYNGGHDAFMALMNKKAAELGMNDTYYEDPSGLNPKNVSTVRDLLKLGRYVYKKHPNLFSTTQVKQYSILKHTWFNQNQFLKYNTFQGGKNGYIDEAKKTTVSIFDVTMARGGNRQVMIVILKSDDREGDALKIINFLKKNAYVKEVVNG